MTARNWSSDRSAPSITGFAPSAAGREEAPVGLEPVDELPVGAEIALVEDEPEPLACGDGWLELADACQGML